MWSVLISLHSRNSTSIKKITLLPSPLISLFTDKQDRLILVFSGDTGLGVLIDGNIELLVKGPVTSAVPAPHGGIYFTRKQQFFHLDEQGSTTLQHWRFDTPSVPINDIVMTPDRCLWLKGQTEKLTADGILQPIAPFPQLPLTMDIYANLWTLTTLESGITQVQVLPANTPQEWQIVQLNNDDIKSTWDYIIADQVGFIWLAGNAGLRRFSPRHPDTNWQILATKPVTSLGLSPDGLALVGYASGDLIEIDVDTTSKALIRSYPSTAETIHCTFTAADGSIWVATTTQLYHYSSAPTAWQKHWYSLAPLPGANHDIFAVELNGSMYTAGGLTDGWGYPPQTHVFDELLAYDVAYDRWQVIIHMPFPLCYNGLAVFNQTIWVVGGSANLHDPENPDGTRVPLDNVHFYNVETRQWTQAPSLNIARNEPTVMAAAGRLYALGGNTPKGTTNTVESIGLNETTWRFEPPMACPFNQAAGCIVDGLLYCINKDGFFSYNPVTRIWDTHLPQLDPSPQAPLVTAYKGEIWVMGGVQLNTSHRYNPTQRKWHTAPPLPTDQSWGAACTLNHRLIIAGGAHWSATHQKYIYENRSFMLNTD